MQRFLDRRYALALYKIAEEKGEVDDFICELKQIQEIINSSKDLHEILENPKISKLEKKKVFKSLFEGKTYDELVSFLCVLIDKGRILYLDEKIRQLDLISLEKKNILEGIVKTAVKLTDDEFDALHKKLELKYGKKILLTAVVDESVIAGVYVRVGDDVIDGTLRTKFSEIKHTMIKSK